MNKFRNPLLIALPAFALGGIVTSSLTSTARAQDVPRPMVAGVNNPWEYRFSTDTKEVDRLGALGWEAYAASEKGIYLKRRM